jgi:hypothetical protein
MNGKRRLLSDGSLLWAPESYFISSGNASGVMTGRRVLMRIPNHGDFSLDEKGFFNETVFMMLE